eukprot:2030204-Pyramimonas_sp.AAC.1
MQGLLYDFVIHSTPMPIWGSNPFDSARLNQTLVVAAPLPLGRTLVQVRVTFMSHRQPARPP